MRRTYFILFGIFLLSLFLRFYKIESSRCLNWDEASFAYNAYSILRTGKDEYGVSLPLQFKSVGDYKAPLFIYLMVPVIKFLGLNEFSVRFLPSLMGSISPVILYFIVFSVFKKSRLALISAFFLAISPWHLQFTRAGADVGVSSFFVLAGIYGFLSGVKGKRLGYFVGLLSFVASLYTYFADRVFIPIFVSFLLFFFRKEILKNKKRFLVASLIAFVLFIPLIAPFVSAGHKEKFFKTTIFGYQRPQEYVSLVKKEDRSEIKFLFFHSALFENSWGAVNRYLNHFSPKFLFIEGVSRDLRQLIYNMGLLYLFEIPLILVGINKLLKWKNRENFFILGWLLLAPIPAAITKDLFHARRSLNMIFPLVIISSLGLDTLIDQIKKFGWKFKILVILASTSAFAYFFFYYLVSYYIFTPLRTHKGPGGWQCGYKQLVEYISPIKNQYEKVVVDTTYQGPYIFFLFYEKYPPALYQPQAKLIQESPDSLGEGYGYDNYVFRPIFWPGDRGLSRTLFAGPPERLPKKDIEEGQARVIKKVNFMNGEEAFIIVETFEAPQGK